MADVNYELWRFCKRPDPACWCLECQRLAAPFWVDDRGDRWVAASDGRVLVMQRESDEDRNDRRVHTVPVAFERVAWAAIEPSPPGAKVLSVNRDAMSRWLEALVSPVLSRDVAGCPKDRECRIDREPVRVRVLGVVVDAGRLAEVLDNAPTSPVRLRASKHLGLVECLDLCSVDWAARVMPLRHDGDNNIPTWPAEVPRG